MRPAVMAFCPFMTSCESIFLSFYRCCLQYLNRWRLNVTKTLLFSREQRQCQSIVMWSRNTEYSTALMAATVSLVLWCLLLYTINLHFTEVQIFNSNQNILYSSRSSLKCVPFCFRRRTPARTRSRWCLSSPA